MKIAEIINVLEKIAPLSLQESYDNAGLLTGNASWECTGIICTLDATEAVVKEAIAKKANMIVAHHPIIFGGLKKINGKNYVEQTVITAIKHDIAIYAIHTNLDNVIDGVNGKIAKQLGLTHISILSGRDNSLKKLYTFVPESHAGMVRDALFAAGGGHIGNYSECSFNTNGTGTFKGNDKSQPHVGTPGSRHQEPEIRIELVFPSNLENSLITALKQAHPYEEVAFDVGALANRHPGIGSGVIGEWVDEIDEQAFLQLLKKVFGTGVIRHTPLSGRMIRKVAVCGGAGSFLVSKALSAGADAFVTADMKYHEFFDANGQMLIADIGHYESEQFTVDLLHDILKEKFPTFAVLKTGVNTNPVNYF